MENNENSLEEFVPPFCPRDNCLHNKVSDIPWPYKKAAFFYTKKKPKGTQRYTCLACGKSFSVQTFAQDYWQRMPDLDGKIINLITGCMSKRQIARALHVSPTTINRHVSRLGRHCMLYHATQMAAASPVTDVVIDGFVTFELSQYFPFHHHKAVEKGTDFFVYFTDSPVRRSGSMTPDQIIRQQELDETIAWSKRRQKSAERLAIFLVWRNYMKGRREKEAKRSPTPAMARGMMDHWVTVEELLEKRFFRWQIELPDRWAEYYDGTVKTVALAVNRRHDLTYAY